MRICCFDQSTKITGYSIWDNEKLVAYGTIDAAKERDLHKRMGFMYGEIKRLTRKYKPDFICLEETQFQSNKKTYRTLAQLQGLIFAVAYECRVGYLVVEPSVWKSYVGIKARRRDDQKKEAMILVEQKYGIKCKTDDLADSICIGLWATGNLLKDC